MGARRLRRRRAACRAPAFPVCVGEAWAGVPSLRAASLALLCRAASPALRAGGAIANHFIPECLFLLQRLTSVLQYL